MTRKIFYFTCAMIVLSVSAKAQWLTNGTHIYNSNTGNVGINGGGALFTPTERFQIRSGNMLMDYNTAGPTGNLYFGGVPRSGVDGMRLAYYVNSPASAAQIDVRMNSLTKGLSFRVDNTTGETERMRINADGNIGINTILPKQKFHVNGNILVDGTQASLFFGGETSGQLTYGEYGIEYLDGATPVSEHGLNFWKPSGSHSGSGGGGFKNYILFLNNDGNIGMGVNPDDIDPAYKLSVCGAIRAQKIKVETGWCDFVFADDYKLMPLSDVERFISANKHLPEIPPASEIETNGADLGALVSKQMQKIEELTLYIIDLEKRVKQMEKN